MASKLTELSRVKDRLGLNQSSNKDTLLDNLILQATDFIERRCGRTFENTRHEEFYDGDEVAVHNHFIHLHIQNPPLKSVLGVHYLGSRDSLSDSGDESENVSLSQLNPISEPNRTWRDFSNLDWKENGTIWMLAPFGFRSIRVRYEGGYAVDFANYSDDSKHELPRDITELVEKLVVKYYLKREEEGVKSADFRDATREYANFLEKDDLRIINYYKQWHALL